MSRLRELYDAAHPNHGNAPTLTELMDWAARELDRAHGWRNNGPAFTEDGAECGDAGDLDEAAVEGERIMSDLVAEDMRFAHSQPHALDDCAEVIDHEPPRERIEARLKRLGYL